ncbi:MAG: hypothetical protein GY864_06540 [Desulfobacterales bacterium]|nr:hypothetical protein [Desulfobacterales bacterium]
MVSVDSSGAQGDSGSYYPSISSDGRYVAFQSYATNLVPGDTNGWGDIFVHDRTTSTTERVSVDNGGTQGDGPSYYASISSDGRYVAFQSFATNLVPGDTNAAWDIFVHDRTTSTTERVSVDSGGTQGDGPSYYASISSDGRYVAYHSWANNLVPRDNNAAWDVFVRDRTTSMTERISVDNGGAQGDDFSSYPSISSDGRYVAFRSYATNLVPGDTNALGDIFVHDRGTSTTERVSVDNSGAQGDSGSFSPSISADGRHVAFRSHATNLVPGDTNALRDIFVHDRGTSTTERVSVDNNGIQGNRGSSAPSISADGRYVAFSSGATNLVPGDTNWRADIFVYDRATSTTERVNVDNGGVQGDHYSYWPSISSDGRYVAFSSGATNLVPGDTNGIWDVFVHSRTAAAIEAVPTLSEWGMIIFIVVMGIYAVQRIKYRIRS